MPTPWEKVLFYVSKAAGFGVFWHIFSRNIVPVTAALSQSLCEMRVPMHIIGLLGLKNRVMAFLAKRKMILPVKLERECCSSMIP